MSAITLKWWNETNPILKEEARDMGNITKYNAERIYKSHKEGMKLEDYVEEENQKEEGDNDDHVI